MRYGRLEDGRVKPLIDPPSGFREHPDYWADGNERPTTIPMDGAAHACACGSPPEYFAVIDHETGAPTVVDSGMEQVRECHWCGVGLVAEGE